MIFPSNPMLYVPGFSNTGPIDAHLSIGIENDDRSELDSKLIYILHMCEQRVYIASVWRGERRRESAWYTKIKSCKKHLARSRANVSQNSLNKHTTYFVCCLSFSQISENFLPRKRNFLIRWARAEDKTLINFHARVIRFFTVVLSLFSDTYNSPRLEFDHGIKDITHNFQLLLFFKNHVPFKNFWLKFINNITCPLP